MGLLEDLQDQQKRQQRVRCHTCRFLSRLTDEERAEIQEALDDDHIYGTIIVEAINKRHGEKVGFLLHETSLQRHRRGRHMTQ